MEWSIPSSTAKRPTGSRNKDDRGKRRRGGKEREQEVLQEGGGSSFMFNHFNRSSPRLGLCAGIKTAAGENRWKFRESQRRARRRRALVLFCRLVMQVTRVTASIDFPSLPPRPPPPPSRIDLGESERITEFPQLREPIDKESSQEKGPAESWGNTFSTFSPPPPLILFSALVQPSIYVLYRHRGNMIAMSKTRKRMGRREEGGKGGRDHRWNERSLNREPDNSVLISLPQFFFLPPFLSTVFYNVFPIIMLEQLSRRGVWTSSRAY